MQKIGEPATAATTINGISKGSAASEKAITRDFASGSTASRPRLRPLSELLGKAGSAWKRTAFEACAEFVEGLSLASGDGD